MEFVREFFAAHGVRLVEELAYGAGFGPDRSARIVYGLREQLVELATSVGAGVPRSMSASGLIERVDVGRLAGDVGVDRGAVREALLRLVPALVVGLGLGASDTDGFAALLGGPAGPDERRVCSAERED